MRGYAVLLYTSCTIGQYGGWVRAEYLPHCVRYCKSYLRLGLDRQEAHPFVDNFGLGLHEPLSAVSHWRMDLPVIVMNYSDSDLSAGFPHPRGPSVPDAVCSGLAHPPLFFTLY